ncbi:hypothetical protein J8J04_01770 ['Fragaria x ananassa' phyllody phytoplasma]|uniref:Effector n=1 Tax='Fragaria x ananassa' phyllody phytoplasma TaxID=2358428 RepID=A0ABS5K3D2_9MOLU|nr:hypothetical protein ['Fragaria x ananassa' phyllody phytoplasma]MBS2126412.1 hypothetical protein ['Fragaria x ananassa' phyllody phytoplasma]
MKKIFKINITIFICLLLMICIFLLYTYQNHFVSKTQELPIIKQPNSKLSKKNWMLVQKLAYLGLNQFKKGLLEKNEDYQNIFEGDPQLFQENVLNGTLSTASTPLIQGTIDFLSEKLNQKICLIINNHPLLCSTIQLIDKETIDLNLKNNGNHFFINISSDTASDGYCFFHAITFLLNQKKIKWEHIINQNWDDCNLISPNTKK